MVPSTEQQEPMPQHDLRQELLEDLSARFASVLEANGSLPVKAQKAMVELLENETLTAEEIIRAASLNDPAKEEGTDE